MMDIWQIMAIAPDQLGAGSAVQVRLGGSVEDLARDMAEAMAGMIRDNNKAGRSTCLIVPVGPVGQYEHLIRIIGEERLDCSHVTLISMDEFLGDDGAWIDSEHPLSFRGFMNRAFYDRLPSRLTIPPENRIFPDPEDLGAVGRAIADRGGVDACFGGIGLNGHLAFNEPEDVDPADYERLPTRVVTLAAESRAHMAVNLSCALDVIPSKAVTVGMREILESRRLRFYANRPWQRGVVRLALHGPVTPKCPASYLHTHPAAEVIVTDFVAEVPEIRLQ